MPMELRISAISRGGTSGRHPCIEHGRWHRDATAKRGRSTLVATYDEDWNALLEAVSALGQLTETEQGFDVSFTDEGGHDRRVVVLMTPDAWFRWVDMRGDDHGELVREVVDLLHSSPPKIQALVATNDYQLVLAPYVPRL